MIYADDILSSGSRDVLTDIANKLSGLLEAKKSKNRVKIAGKGKCRANRGAYQHRSDQAERQNVQNPLANHPVSC